MKTALPILAALLLSPLLLAQEPEAKEETAAYPGLWNQWRGPQRDGIAGAPSWPKRLTQDSVEAQWRVKMGPSYSGPVVDSERVYSTETVDKKDEVTRAFDRKTGKELWKHSWTGSIKVPFFARRNGSWIRSTPAVDESSLYVVGIRDVLVCLDKTNGKERWRVDFAKRFDVRNPDFGAVCSPLVDDKYVYIQAASSMVKLDKKTGETVWRSMEGGDDMMSGGAFSSPVIATVAGREQLLVQTRSHLHGVSLEDGASLWNTKVRTFRGMNILTPLPFKDGVITSAYGGRGHFFEVTGDEDGLEVAERWTNRSQGYMTSPVVVDGHAYLYLRSKRFTCFEVATGEVKWISDSVGDEYWSLIAQGDRILALNETGRLRLIAANPKAYEVIDEVEVASSESWAHLAIDGDQILVRDLDGLSAFHWKR